MAKHYILMGDVVGSKRLPPATMFDGLNRLLGTLNQTFKPELVSPLRLGMGDEFQGLPISLEAMLRVVLSADEALLFADEADDLSKLDLHYVLAFGEITTQANPLTATGMQGPGLWDAHRLLNDKRYGRKSSTQRSNITARSRGRYIFALGDARLDDIMSDLMYNIEWLRRHWSRKDFAIAKRMLEEPDDVVLAAEFSQNRSSIYRKRITLRVPEYVRLKSAVLSLAGIFLPRLLAQAA